MTEEKITFQMTLTTPRGMTRDRYVENINEQFSTEDRFSDVKARIKEGTKYQIWIRSKGEIPLSASTTKSDEIREFLTAQGLMSNKSSHRRG